MKYYTILVIIMLATILKAEIVDDFESGTLLNLNWESYGDANWITSNISSGDGSYSAKSGLIYDSQQSDLTIELVYETEGEIAFFRKVSCEPQGNSVYDGLFFYIDDEEVAVWAGEADWEEFTFPVTQGVHTFRWSYIKDYTTLNGSDCAWIDNVVFDNAVIPTDNDAPELISLTGNEVLTGEDMLPIIKVRDANFIESAIAKVTIDGTTESVIMSLLNKDRRFYNYQANLTTHDTPQAGTICFILEDVIGNIDTTATYDIGWYPHPINYLTESFEGGEIPEGWNSVQVNGTLGEWSVESEALSPSGTLPQDGTKLIRYSSGFTAFDNDVRLELPPINISKTYSHVMISFYLFHSLGNTWANDSLIVQVKNNSDWLDVERVYRYTGSPNKWQKYEINLDDFVSEDTLKISLLACSANGRDLNIDNLKIYREFDITGIDEYEASISTYQLKQNYPNPFNPHTRISYTLKESNKVKLSVYNSKGEFIKELVNKKINAGNHYIDFNGQNLNSGVYLYSLSVNGKVIQSKKMILLK